MKSNSSLFGAGFGVGFGVPASAGLFSTAKARLKPELQTLIPILTISVAASMVSAQQPTSPPAKQTQPTAADEASPPSITGITGPISGRVTRDGKGVTGVVVGLRILDFNSPRSPLIKATTSQDGRFRLTGVAAGRYSLAALAPAFVSENGFGFGSSSVSVILAEGETVEGIELALVPGGVITGRVVDADGHPVIGEHVDLTLVSEHVQKRPVYLYSPSASIYETDDRGIYRLFGLPAGRYLVSVGVGKDNNSSPTGIPNGRSYYPRTFHPGVTEEAKATVVEVTAGGEAPGVNITLSERAAAYTVTGRLRHAENGQPVANIRVRYATLREDGRSFAATALGSTAHFNGEFRFEGILPGKYVAFVTAESESAFYGDPVPFEVTNGDVAGVEVKLRRGATIAGHAVVEGASDPAILAFLAQLRLWANTSSPERSLPSSTSTEILPDGSFRFTGIPPGKTTIRQSLPTPKGFSLLRVERDGVEQRDGIEVTPTTEVIGVRLVFAYGTGTIRGQVKITGGTLPTGVGLMLDIVRTSNQERVFAPYSQPDAQGRFLIDGLMAGDYDISIRMAINRFLFNPSTPLPNLPTFKQTVTVKDGTESEVIFTSDLSPKEKER